MNQTAHKIYAPASIINESDLQRAFDDRRRLLLNHIAHWRRPTEDIHRKFMYYSIARLATGVDVDGALKDLAFVNHDPGNAAMFFVHANIDGYLRFRHLYPQSLRDQAKKRMLEPYEIHHGHTENHRILIAVAGYLVAQTFPDWSESAVTFAKMRTYLDRFFDRVCRFGQGEFDSTTYSVLYLITLATLFDFAADDLMRQKARMMLDWFLAGAAGEWLNGYFIGAHSRENHATEGPEFATAGCTALWLYFGGRQPNFNTGEPHYAILSALTAYRMPSILARIALDRSCAYEHLESHDLLKIDGETHDLVATKNIDAQSKGYGYVSQVGIRKYNWRTPNYALGSVYDGKQGDVNFWAQVRRWSLDWDSDFPNSTLFFTHPFPDPQDASERYYKEWIGSSPFEQTLQHRGSLIALYNVPEDGTYFHPFTKKHFAASKNPFIEGFFSAASIAILREDPSGWIFAHGRSVLIAIRPLRPYRWIQPRNEAGAHGRLRSDGGKNAVIIETADPLSYLSSSPDTPGEGRGEGRKEAAPHVQKMTSDPDPRELESQLTRFAAAILSKTRITPNLDAPAPAVSFTSLAGDKLDFTYNAERRVNGDTINYNDWPLIHSPYMHSAVGSAKLELNYAKEIRALDFNTWTITTTARVPDFKVER